MALVVPDIGEEEMLNRILGIAGATTGEKVHLYSNLYTPVDTSVLGDFTELTTNDLGNPDSALATGWSVAGTDPTVATAVQIDFAFTAGLAKNCYGYYVTDGSGLLLWAEEFVDGPYAIPTGGGNIYITPKIELS